VDASLILVPVTVTDTRGSNIEGLGVESFTLLDNQRPQAIVAFYSHDVPAAIGIVVDVSGSTLHILEQEKAAIRAVLDYSNPEDDFFLAAVSSKPQLLAERVNSPGEIENLLLWQRASGATALCDAVHFALNKLKSRQLARHVLLVVSDGMDNHSLYSKEDLMREVVEADTQIYTIGLDNAKTESKGLFWAESRRGLALMDDLAEKSGGLSVRLGDNRDPAAAAARISAAIRSQYVLAYRGPDRGESERWHRIQVKVNIRNASVRARQGYRMP
jgi:VWFA-related protein